MNEVTINFKYKFPEDYNPVYSNGAYGGVNPSCDIVMNFYFERNPIPYKETRKINSSGEFIGEPITEPQDHNSTVIRYITNGVVMNLESAKTFHKWLEQHIQRLEMEKNNEGRDR